MSRSSLRGPARTDSYRGGFTLLEIMVAMAIMLTIGGIGLFVSMETYTGANFHSDRDLVVALLQHARAQSVSNVCLGTCSDGATHGVHIDIATHTYTVFQGTYSTSDPLNQSFPRSPTTSLGVGSDTEVTFQQLSGAVAAAKTFKLLGEGRSSDITIDPSGRISWTN